MGMWNWNEWQRNKGESAMPPCPHAQAQEIQAHSQAEINSCLMG
jgi:hypothetical protein